VLFLVRRYRRPALSDEPTAREFALLARLQKRLPAIGDDAAVLDATTPSGRLLASVDTLVAGVDWRDEWSSPADVGWKSIMVNASDIAAMGGVPRWFLVALVVSPGFDVDAFYDGALEACAAGDASVVGGDLSSGPATMVSVTALGHADRPVMRNGAHVGDAVWVSGPLGAAGRDLRELSGGHQVDGRAHRRPVARVDAGLAAAEAGATAMIDISDGLVADAHHIARASNVMLALDSLPVADGATRGDALYGGDDYELLATTPPDAQLDGWVRIGMCVSGAPEVTVDGNLVDPQGWEHEL
jgi:thiamine-monophosphate kinase